MRKIYFLLIFFISAITYSEAQCPLICNDNVIVSLDYNCEHRITVDDVLENPGPASCYTLEIYDEYGNFVPGDIIDGNLLGQTIGVKVILANGNYCESWVIVRETHPPVFNCAPDITLKCYGSGGGLPPVYDNCDPNPQIILLSDNYVNLPCSSPFTGERSISYKAIDASGNESAICTQTIHYERADLDDVFFPLDRDGSPLPPLDCDNTYWDKNGNGYPDPSEVGVPTIDGVELYPSQFCDLWVEYDDLIWPLNCGTKIMRTWTITDECSGEQVSAAQIIKLTSTSAPTLTCPGDQTVSANGVDCKADVVLPEIHVSGGCGGTGSYTVSIPGYSVVFNGTHWVARNLPAGVYYVTYTGSSSCGSGTSTCTIKLTVTEGGNGPIPVCDQNTVVAIGGNGKARVYASTFNDGSYDDCGPITIKVRRMNPGNCPPDVVDDTKFRDYIEVCCADIAQSPIQVILQVTNKQGQKNQCMVLVHVQDKLPPTIYCPPNITIDCDFDFDLNNLSEFGRVVTDPSDRRDIYINGKYVGRDGLAKDNCNVHVTEKHITNITCNQGVITRIFTATDDFGRSSTCTQRITVIGNGGNGNNINWPNNVTINECMSNNTHPDQTGYPQWGNNDCSLLAWSYRDEVYRFADGGCVKILRYWKVLDWCIFDPETGRGLYSDIQVIKVTDDNAPQMLDNCEDKTFCTVSGNGCQGYIDYNPIFEDCTPQSHLEFEVKIDLFSDGTIDRIDRDGDLSGNYPFGTHTIRWNVNDGCGNTFKCTNQITVSDCKKPTAVCYHGISTVLMPESGSLGLSIRFFNRNSFDNCTPESKLRFSYSSDVRDTIKFYDCDMLGPDTIQMWVTDQAGNQNYCTTYVLIQDNMGACPDSASTMVSGLVLTTEGDPVMNSHVTVSHPSMSQQLITTDEDGYYEYASRMGYSFSNVQVKPFKNNDVLNGVTSYDLFVIYKVLQGKITLNQAAEKIAADVNNDGKINNQDVLQLRQLLLGVYDKLPENTSWVFANDDIGFDFDNPFSYTNDALVSFPGAKATNFTGIKIADLNGTVVSGLQSDFRNNEVFTLNYNDIELVKGNTYDVKLTLSGKAEVQSFQLYFDQLDKSIEIVDQVLSTDGSLAWHALGDESFNIVMINDEAESYDNELFVTLKVIANVDGRLSDYLAISADQHSLVADNSGSEREIVLRNSDSGSINISVTSFPNPVLDEWNLKIDASDSGEINLRIYSADGKMIDEGSYEIHKGSQNIRIDNVKTLSKGIYFYKAMINNQSFTGNIVKM